jgi:hypothetical protein
VAAETQTGAASSERPYKETSRPRQMPKCVGKCRTPSPFAERRGRRRQMPKPFGKCRAAESSTANGDARTGLRPDRTGVSFYPCGCSGQPWQNVLPGQPLPPAGHLSARSAGPDKCPHPPVLGTNVRRPGQMSEREIAPDKCPSPKWPRTNVQALDSRRQMPATFGKCRSPRHMAGGWTSVSDFLTAPCVQKSDTSCPDPPRRAAGLTNVPTLPRPEQMSAARTNVRTRRGPGQMSAARDKCPGRKTPRTNVQAPDGGRQMPRRETAPDICPLAPRARTNVQAGKPPRTNVRAPNRRGQMSGPRTAAGRCRTPSANAEAPAGTRQMPTAQAARGKCRVAKRRRQMPRPRTAAGKCRHPSANAGQLRQMPANFGKCRSPTWPAANADSPNGTRQMPGHELACEGAGLP